MVDTKQSIFYTSYFGNRVLNDEQYILVNIASKPPKWFPYKLYTFKPCVPESFTLSAWYRSQKDEEAKVNYIKSYYKTVLNTEKHRQSAINLHIQELNKMGTILEREYGDKGLPIVLLCYESPGMFCHRLVYTTYLKITTGVHIPELGDIENQEDSILIEDTLRRIMIEGV